MIHSQDLGVPEIREINRPSSALTHFLHLIETGMSLKTLFALSWQAENHTCIFICHIFLFFSKQACGLQEDAVSAVMMIVQIFTGADILRRKERAEV